MSEFQSRQFHWVPEEMLFYSASEALDADWGAACWVVSHPHFDELLRLAKQFRSASSPEERGFAKTDFDNWLKENK